MFLNAVLPSASVGGLASQDPSPVSPLRSSDLPLLNRRSPNLGLVALPMGIGFSRKVESAACLRPAQATPPPPTNPHGEAGQRIPCADCPRSVQGMLDVRRFVGAEGELGLLPKSNGIALSGGSGKVEKLPPGKPEGHLGRRFDPARSHRELPIHAADRDEHLPSR